MQDRPTPAVVSRPDLPLWVCQVLEIALAQKPEARFQTALLFREALMRGLANLPIETAAPTEVPPELIATAAPSSLPVLTPLGDDPPSVLKVEIPVVPSHSPAEDVAPAASRALPPVHPSVRPGADERRSMVPLLAAAGIAVVLLAGGWLWMRSGASPSGAAPTPVTQAVTTPRPESPPVPPVPPVTDAQPAAAAAPPAGPPPSPMPARGTEGLVAPAARGGAEVAAAGPVRGRSTAPAARASGPADAPMTYRDVRAFLVVGGKVEERDAQLTFGNGRVAATDQTGRTAYATVAYADVAAVAHSRGENPRWLPAFGGPPPKLDMPGGLFRSDRHWIAFQSRTGYVIVRVNDDDYRGVLETSNARLKVKAQTLAAR